MARRRRPVGAHTQGRPQISSNFPYGPNKGQQRPLTYGPPTSPTRVPANPQDFTGVAGAPGPAPQPEGIGGPPVDPYLEALKTSALRSQTLGNAYDVYKTGQIESDYGFNAQGGIDVNNPYSRAALLQHSYQQGQRGTGTSYAARKFQRQSGAYQNALAYGTRQFDVGVDALKKQRQQALDEILLGKVNRYSQTGAEVDQAQLDALLKAFGAK